MEKFPKITTEELEESEKGTPDYATLLENIADTLMEMKEEGKIGQEEINRFYTTRDMIDNMADERHQKVEKSVLVKKYQDLIRSLR